MDISAAILGVEGPMATPEELVFFKQAQPWGFILFARNVENPRQLRRLTSMLRDSVGRDAPIMIDQEGGRVARMRAPYWREFLPALTQMERARDPMRGQWIRNRLIADDLRSVGIDVNLAPLADLVEPQTHPVLKNRLYGEDIETVVRACQVAADAMIHGGVVPVLKHLPGYGRASVDSHFKLPTVDASLAELEARDFAPFRDLHAMTMGMTAHVVYTALDEIAPATISRPVMNYIRNRIEFDGLIMTDDISMEALDGPIVERSAKAIAAGCDIVLHCNGNLRQMQGVVDVVGVMTEDAKRRSLFALQERDNTIESDIAELEAELQGLLT